MGVDGFGAVELESELVGGVDVFSVEAEVPGDEAALVCGEAGGIARVICVKEEFNDNRLIDLSRSKLSGSRLLSELV